MSRSSRLNARIRILTAAVAVGALATILSCGENPLAPGEGSTIINANGTLQTIYHYPESVVHPASDRDPALTTSLLTSGVGISADGFVGVSGPTYNVTSVPFAPEVAPTTGPLAPTQEFAVSVPIPIGFTFAFFGNNYSELQIGAGGLVGFGNGNIRDGCCAGRLIPRVDPNYKNLIAVGWSLWVLNGKSVKYETRGLAPNRRFVVQFNNLTEDGGTGVFTAQLVLYEHSNDIVIYTTALSTSARSHAITQGIENLAGTEAEYVAGRDSARFAISNDGVKFSLVAVNTPPVITQPGDLVFETSPAACAANVTVANPTFTDDAPGATIAGARSDGAALNAAYPKGVTTITWTATDVDGLKSTATQKVTINDKEKPTVTPPANISVRTDVLVSLATVSVGTATAADNCPNVTVAGVRSDAAPLTARYPVGVTTITWTATDASSNTASATQTVTVAPNAPPVITVPAPVTFNTAPGVCSALATLVPATATDDLPGVVVSGARNDGAPIDAPYPKGVTTVTWTATDVDRATSSGTQSVTVVDQEKPVIAAPDNVSVRTGVKVSVATVDPGVARASDNCMNPQITGVRSDNNSLSEPFPLGVTTIVWTAADGSHNFASASQTVTVTPNQLPVLTVPAAVTFNTAPGVCAANVSLVAATATDDLPGVAVNGARSDALSLDAPYSTGLTTVTWTATDVDGASVSGTQGVTIVDQEKPAIMAPADVNVRTDVRLSVASLDAGVAHASDNCPNVRVEGVRSDNGSLSAPFPVGVTTITWTATDASNNSASAIQKVTVTPNQPPVISVPPAVTFSTAPGVCSANVSLVAATATDDLPGVAISAARSDALSLDAPYPKGVVTVTWTATDVDGASVSGTQSVTVVDHERPTILAPADVTVGNDPGANYARVSVGSPTAGDNCQSVTVSSSRSDGRGLGDSYPVGSTTITWSVTDASGNSASTLQHVVVNDVESPRVSVPANFAVNATMPAGAVVNYSASAADNVGVSSFSCDLASGSVFAVGANTVTCTARDAAGNTTVARFVVDVVSAARQLQSLLNYVNGMSLPNGVQRPLVAQLLAAQRLGSDPLACAKLDDFIHMVGVKSSGLSADQATYLIGEARRIEAAKGCTPSA